MANKNMKNDQHYQSLKMQIKTTIRYHFILIKMPKILNVDNINCGATGMLING